MPCGSCGSVSPSGKKYRATFPNNEVRDYLSRAQAVKALYVAGGGSIVAVDASAPVPGGSTA